MTKNKLNQYYSLIKDRKEVYAGSPASSAFHVLAQRAIKLCTKINKKYHKKKKLNKIFSKLINKPVDASFTLFPPFTTDCGLNIKIGKNVFINSNCSFQDQGKIYIGNNVFIGHHVVIATINHGLYYEDRDNMFLKEVVIEDNVWIGSNTTILPGVKIGKNSIVGAGSLVNKDVLPDSIYVGNPAKFLKKIEKSK